MRDAVNNVQHVVVARQVQVGSVRVENFRTYTWRPLVVKFESKPEWLRVLDINVQDAFARYASGL